MHSFPFRRSKHSSDSLDSELFQNLMQHTTDGVYFKDRDSRFIAISDCLATQFGQSTEDLLGRTDFDVFTSEHAQQAFNDEQDIIRTGKPVVDKIEKETWPDGHTTWVSSSKLPLYDRNGEIIGIFGISRNITDQKLAQDALQQREEQLRLQNDAMRRDLQRARLIQRALLPAAPPYHDRLRIDVRYLPLDAIGGDYFTFACLPHHGVGIFLGDLTGHGVSAALFMALVKFLTDRLCASRGDEPKAFLEALNVDLMHQMPLSFITANYGAFRFDESRHSAALRLAGAAHPLPILQRRNGQIELLNVTGNAAIGLIPEFQADELSLGLDRGDRLFLYTDGITETRNERDEMLGQDRMAEMIDGTRGDLRQALDGIISRVNGFRGQAELLDDIVLIGLEVA